MSEERGRLFVVTGIRSAGKTTVGRALAENLDRAVFIDGETISAMVVSGAVPLTPAVSTAGVEQLFLRYAGALVLADTYRSAGFDAVIADNIFGSFLEDFLVLADPEPVHLVVLHPGAEVVAARDVGRANAVSRDVPSIDGLWLSLEHETRHVGLWLDTSDLGVAETVYQILERQDEAAVGSMASPNAQ